MPRMFGCMSNQFQVFNNYRANEAPAGPTQPNVITTMIVGNPSGQQPKLVVRDMTNDWDLYTKNPDTVYNAPASTTKLMTLLLMWEYKQSVWTNTVTVVTADVTQPYAGINLSSAGLQANDVISWEDLAYCANLPSGFDACWCAARIIGNELYAAAGNTGTQGLTRFVERMNARAAELGMTNATFFDPGGTATTFSPTVNRNMMSARDLSIITEYVYSIPTMRTIGGTVTRNITITGVNARTMAKKHACRFVNGPVFGTQADVKDSVVIAGKSGSWQVTGLNAFSTALVMTTPSGYEVSLVNLGSETAFGQMLDVRGIMYSLLKDFPYLLGSEVIGTDASFANVELLIGGDGSIADESNNSRTLTNTSVTVGSPVISDSTGAVAVNASSDGLTVADASDLVIGSGNLTIELWWAGAGTPPSDGVEYLFAAKASAGQREFALNYFSGGFNLFVSSDGSNWTSALLYSLSVAGSVASEKGTLFNGAPRHIALVKNGSAWNMYLCGDKLATGVTVSTPFNGTAALAAVFPGSALLGTIDDYRVTYGVARYTGGVVTLSPRKFPRS